MDRESVLLTGATGYVGGRLLPALEAAGFRVRCLARRPDFMASRVRPNTEVARGDLLDPSSLGPAFAGVHTAYYLVHSLGSKEDFERKDREAATNFGAAAREAGVKRIVYLGGLGQGHERLSPHLRSRHETGDALRASGVPVVEFRAAVILGSGSLSFELIRALVERLPAMITPRWVQVKTQPIAIEDVVAYLLAALDLPPGQGGIFEVGGADQVSYGEIMLEYARQRGLRRLLIPVPFLTPRLSSLWLGLTTPVYARVGRKLIESVRNPTVVCDPSARTVFPIRPLGFRKSIERAMVNEDREFAATRWLEALSSAGAVRSWAGVRLGSRLVDSREARVAASPAAAFAPIRRIGGRNGWYCADWLWKIRGFLDLLAGGVGSRRGRRDPEDLVVGDALDFWRVEAFEPNRRLRLAAEMRLPGRAWLEFEVREGEHGGAIIRQTAVFDPAGLLGLAYWYGVYPLHSLVFAGMLRGITRKSDPGRADSGTGPSRATPASRARPSR
jgi:uncharacterized protein YbjT (DUF2867 family)